jgi:hypothetical protein
MIARDRHVEGCWTGYNPSLERAVLKKARYLEEELIDPAVRGDISEPATPLPPQPPDAPPAPQHQEHHAPLNTSVFAEKLQQAWRKEP